MCKKFMHRFQRSNANRRTATRTDGHSIHQYCNGNVRCELIKVNLLQCMRSLVYFPVTNYGPDRQWMRYLLTIGSYPKFDQGIKRISLNDRNITLTKAMIWCYNSLYTIHHGN